MVATRSPSRKDCLASDCSGHASIKTVIPEVTGHRSRHDYASYDIQEVLAIPSVSEADARVGGHTDRAVVPCPLRGTSYLLYRMRSTPQVPMHRIAKRGEATIATWGDVNWVKLRASGGRGLLCFE